MPTNKRKRAQYLASQVDTPSSTSYTQTSKDASNQKGNDTNKSTASSYNNKKLVPTTNPTPIRSIAETLFGGPGPKVMPMDEIHSTATMSQGELKEDCSIPHTVVACNQKQNVKYESNASEFSSQREANYMEKTIVSLVVTEKFFPEVKFADKDFALAWDDDKESFCQFFISKCNLPTAVDRKKWWSQTKKMITNIMLQTRNDRNTAMKHSFIGKYETIHSNRCADID